MNGIMNKRSMEDEIMVQEIGKTAQCNRSLVNNSWVMIYDARPYLNAQANKIKNGGFESRRYYRNADIEFCDIDNIHEVTKTYRKMYDISLNPANFESAASFNKAVEDSGYFKVISRILKASNMVVE
jgi:hypothetical protein